MKDFDMDATPNPDLVYDLFGGIFKPQFIRLALVLDVFAPLAQNLSTAEQIAKACQCDAAGIKALPDNLCAAQILEFHGGHKWLEESGFRTANQLSGRWLAARK